MGREGPPSASHSAASVGPVTLVPMTAAIAAPVPAVRPAPLDRLPGTADDDPFLRLAAACLVGHPTNTAKAVTIQLAAGIQMFPLVSSVRASKGRRPCLAAVAR
jgi:hypothetical protein